MSASVQLGALSSTEPEFITDLEHWKRFRRVVEGCLVVQDVTEPLDVATIRPAAGLHFVKDKF